MFTSILPDVSAGNLILADVRPSPVESANSPLGIVIAVILVVAGIWFVRSRIRRGR